MSTDTYAGAGTYTDPNANAGADAGTYTDARPNAYTSTYPDPYPHPDSL